MIAGSTVSFRCARYLVKDDRVYPFAIAVVIGGIVGARIAHIVDNPAYYGGDFVKMLDISRGGIGTMGAPIGSTVAGLIFSRWLRLPRGFMFDVSVIGISLGEAIGRLGDIVNGEHHGTACDLPWCVRYTHPLTLGQSTPVHPIGAYDALLMTAIFVVLVLYWRRVRGHPPEGRVYFAYLVLLGLGRLLQGFVRVEPVVALGWTEAQILGGLYALAGFVGLLIVQKPLPKEVSDR
jgi:phosphatidylglycerol:prolipoprotein diacylglycerol transferase